MFSSSSWTSTPLHASTALMASLLPRRLPGCCSCWLPSRHPTGSWWPACSAPPWRRWHSSWRMLVGVGGHSLPEKRGAGAGIMLVRAFFPIFNLSPHQSVCLPRPDVPPMCPPCMCPPAERYQATLDAAAAAEAEAPAAPAPAAATSRAAAAAAAAREQQPAQPHPQQPGAGAPPQLPVSTSAGQGQEEVASPLAGRAVATGARLAALALG